MSRMLVHATVVALVIGAAGQAAAQGVSASPTPPPAAAAPTVDRTVVVLPPEVLARYVGRYRIGPPLHADITLEGGKLYGALSGRPKHELFAETPTRFFATDVNAQIVFEPGPDGRATSAVLTIEGQVAEAQRVADADPDTP